MPKSVPKTGDRYTGSSSTCQPSGGRKRKHEPVASGPYQLADRSITNRKPVSTAARSSAASQQSPTVAMPSSASDSPPTGRGAAATDLMLQALGRIRELQDELDFLQNDPYAEDTDDEEEEGAGVEVQHGAVRQPPVQVIGGRQAEAIGWAVCARETMHFLQREGIPPDSPLMVNLRRRLVGRARDDPDEGCAFC
ncbi:uncharacterized protein LOC5667411 [Anopheles gambiae]|uniref:uncharacterized protein LOC5667411 n=1 Tax=Anopheles gambiae TaxID=7165 RepID=UPI002AC8D9FE|nr:uncharacterized protein LOC5667411 [Anopheles gambiae]